MKDFEKLFAELEAKHEAELKAAGDDEYKIWKADLDYNIEYGKLWMEKREAQNTKNPYDMVGKKVTAKNGNWFGKRVLKQDEKGLYVLADSMKGYVTYDRVFDNFKIEYYELKK